MRIALFGIMLIFCIANITAKDLGQRGPVYPIIEVNLLDHIYERLNTLHKLDQIKDLQSKYVRHVEQAVANPRGLDLPQALSNTTRLYDPSLVLQKDITNEKGALIAKAGTKINPLTYISLSKRLVFINANRDEEINYAKKLSENLNNKIILVNGNIKNTNTKLSIPVYFDQDSSLIKRFALTHTPSVISQEGDKLLIKEVAL